MFFALLFVCTIPCFSFGVILMICADFIHTISIILSLSLSFSVVEDVEEALVELFFPELTLGCDPDNHKALVRS